MSCTNPPDFYRQEKDRQKTAQPHAMLNAMWTRIDEKCYPCGEDIQDYWEEDDTVLTNISGGALSQSSKEDLNSD